MKRLLMALPLMMMACGNDNTIAKFIVVDKKMPLTEWPDSSYIASLDSVLAHEPVIAKKDVDANLTMKGFKAPGFKLPPSVTGKPDPKKTSKGSSPVTPKKNNMLADKSNNSGNNAEQFANKFSDALSRLQSDPSNSSLYRTVEAKDGDDLFKLLRRTYGAGVQNLPRFYILSALQSVNAGVALEHLEAGDKVRVPKI